VIHQVVQHKIQTRAVHRRVTTIQHVGVHDKGNRVATRAAGNDRASAGNYRLVCGSLKARYKGHICTACGARTVAIAKSLIIVGSVLS
jgi:hypothetical protein